LSSEVEKGAVVRERRLYERMFIAIVALVCIVQVATLTLNGTKFNYNHSGKQRRSPPGAPRRRDQETETRCKL
jgi:hypothetical protein